jgi:hypothetical protein
MDAKLAGAIVGATLAGMSLKQAAEKRLLTIYREYDSVSARFAGGTNARL